jgi:hypothetical protein
MMDNAVPTGTCRVEIYGWPYNYTALNVHFPFGVEMGGLNHTALNDMTNLN